MDDMAAGGASGALETLLREASRRDVALLVARMTEGVELHDMPRDVEAQGLPAVRGLLEGWIAALPDASLEVTRTVRVPEREAAEIVLRGSWDGAPIELPVAVVARLEGDAIAGITLYYDLATLLVQVGAL